MTARELLLVLGGMMIGCSLTCIVMAWLERTPRR